MLIQKGCGISYWDGIPLRVMEGGGGGLVVESSLRRS